MKSKNENLDERDTLLAAMQVNFSPAAVAAIACHLYSSYGGKTEVSGELMWFAKMLIDSLGVDNYNCLIEETGL